jgi:hypothetical protein
MLRSILLSQPSTRVRKIGVGQELEEFVFCVCSKFVPKLLISSCCCTFFARENFGGSFDTDSICNTDVIKGT